MSDGEEQGIRVMSYIASRMSRVQVSPTMAVTDKARAMKAAGMDVVDVRRFEGYPNPEALAYDK